MCKKLKDQFYSVFLKLQELGGWSTPEMVQKYAHLSSEHLAQWVDRRPVISSVDSLKSDTLLATGNKKEAGYLS